MNILLLMLFITSSLHAGIESLHYKILPGKYHKSGTLDASVTKIDFKKNVMEVSFKYDVIKRPMIPAPANLLKSSMIIEFPLEFQDERGYLNLELSKTLNVEHAKIVHAGRVRLGAHKDAHHVRIIGKNGKYTCDVYYHPAVPELGWPVIKLLLNVTLLSNYEMKAELK